MIQAFALELYLKCLKACETKDHLREHNLKLLYYDLSSADQEKVKKYAEEDEAKRPYPPELEKAIGKKPPFDIDSILDISAVAFELFRYSHEGMPTTPHGFIAASVEVGARRVILEHHPEWVPQ